MTQEVKAEFPIGKTQWAKWGPEAREAFNKCGRLGFKLATAVEEANAVQAKVRSKALAELALLGQEQDAEGVAQPDDVTEAASPSPTASAPKKPRTPRKKKA
jgi:hypothetical protein